MKTLYALATAMMLSAYVIGGQVTFNKMNQNLNREELFGKIKAACQG